MSNNEYVVSLDIGTSKIRVIIAEKSSGSIHIIGVGTADSKGIKKGSIVDIDQTVQAIRQAVENAERMVALPIHEVYIGIAGNHIELTPTHGVVAVSSEDREIRDEDIDRVMNAARVVNISPEREIIDVIPTQYIVDGLDGINDPLGMVGVRLEMEGIIVSGSKTMMQNLIRCVKRADLEITGVILQPYATSMLALSDDEKNLGVVLADIGAGSTTISIFDQGSLVATSVIPLGGDMITNDIAIGLRTQTDVAEKVKLKYGCALVEDALESETFRVPRIGSNVEKEFDQIDLAHIIEARLVEIYEMIEKEVKRLGFREEIPGGYVLTGGVMAMPGALDLARDILQTSVRVAVPDYIGVRTPAFTAGVGLVKYAFQKSRKRRTLTTTASPATYAAPSNRNTQNVDDESSEGFFDKMKNWLKEFI
ncbi:cell division protein FtsA [Rubeoparvulum massiliense]|uniref:cell division protein FtsA n=1 Tax=Rubeoparvulum massiliense TaxID=1631346 RepID=UPI00065E499D|nr:cell division protein FtsA [Rubeoparvulum massiliense]